MRILLFLLLLPSVLAVTNPADYTSLTLQGKIENTFELQAAGPDPIVASLLANTSWVPLSLPTQSVDSLSSIPYATITDTALFTLIKPELGTHTLRLDYKVTTHARNSPIKKRIPFPLQGVATSFSLYTKPTETIDITPEMRSLATSLVKDVDDAFIAAVTLGSWVHKHVEYNLSTLAVEANQPSSWVLANRQGVCDEITNLFISMARSVGIPARFVSGVSYTASPLFAEEWGAHGWAELYFPDVGWVPFDVTYGQFGWIDATHVAFRTGVDSGKYVTTYTWTGHDTKLLTKDLGLETVILKYGSKVDALLNLDVSVLKKTVGFGSYDLVTVMVTNPTPYYVADEISLHPVEGITMLDPQSVMIGVSPGEYVLHTWMIAVSPDLQKGYRYTFPIMVSTGRKASGETKLYATNEGDYLTKEWVGLQQKPDVHPTLSSLQCSPNITEPYISETFLIACEGAQSSQVCYRGTCVPVVQPVTNLPVSFSSSGLYALTIAAGADTAIVPVTIIDPPAITIMDVSSPEKLDYNEKGEIRFQLSASGNPHDVKVAISGYRVEENWDFPLLQGKNEFSLVIPGAIIYDDAEEYALLITFSDGRGGMKTISDKVIINRGKSKFWERFEQWVSDLLFRLNL